MPYKIRAVCLILGTSLPTEGPGLSARMRLMLEPPLKGMIASIKTKTPMPPIQLVNERHNKLQLDNASTSLSMLAPVVENPDTVSNKAFMKKGISPVIQKGRQPKILITIQHNAVVTQPSFK